MNDLEALAARHGVLTSYRGQGPGPSGGSDRVVRASAEAVVAVLAALGVPIESPAGAAAALRDEEAAASRRALASPIEQVIVQQLRRPEPIAVTLPRSVHPRDVWLTLEHQDGEVHRVRLLAAIARPMGTTGEGPARIDRYQLRLGGIGAELPPGYHHLRLEGPSVSASSFVIAAHRAPRARTGWGMFLPLHALRSDHDIGVGSYSDLAELCEWAGGCGASFVGTLPLFPAFGPVGTGSVAAGPVAAGPVDAGCVDDVSPYLPVSRLAWNELYIDPTALPELAVTPEAQAALSSPAWREQVAAARRSALADYSGAGSALRRVLEPMARALEDAGSARHDELAAFAEVRPDLVAYARFRAAHEQWGIDGRRRERPRELPSEPDPTLVAYHLYVQWAADQQIRAVGTGEQAGLYLDLPLGVHPSGFDPWWEPELFVAGVRVGAPPDAFFPAGQDWGCPPIHPERLRAQRFGYVRDVLRHLFGPARAVRIDHVMGLHRQYWIPRGFAPSDGVYVRYPSNELRAVVALEAHRAGVVVVGEDLGTVEEEVRQDMASDRMLRSWVFQFESSVADPLPVPPAEAMASWGTHDLPRFAASWGRPERAPWRAAVVAALSDGAAEAGATGEAGLADASDLDEGAGLAEGPDELDEFEVYHRWLDYLAASPAALVMVDLEDLWGERCPQNRPGTTDPMNWRHRASRDLGAIKSDPRIAGLLAEVTRRRAGGGAP